MNNNINHMKKLIIVFLLLHLSTHSQENDKYYFRMHYLDVSGNVGAFIKANKEYFKLLAKEDVKNGKWAGWSMLRSIREPSKFIFVHHFNSSKQLENIYTNGGLFSSETAKKLGLKNPDWSKWSWKVFKPYEIWERNGFVVDDEPSKFFILNHFKFKNKKKFIENNRLWGKMVVKPQLKDRNGFSWGCATILSYGEWDNGSWKSYNGMSWDGFGSLSEIIDGWSYNENETIDDSAKYWKAFSDAIKKNDLGDVMIAKQSEIYEHIDSTWMN